MQTKDEINKAIKCKKAMLNLTIEESLKTEQNIEDRCDEFRKDIDDLKKMTPFDDTLAGQVAILTNEVMAKIEILLVELEQKTGIKLEMIVM